MKKSYLDMWINPFAKIAGGKALILGLTGMLLSVLVGFLNQWHYHGLLHFGLASNNNWWCFLAEQLIIWIVISLLFYLGGIIFSKSKVRPIDVLGTVAFAMLPLLLMNLYSLLPVMQSLKDIDLSTSPVEMMSQPGFYVMIWVSLLGSLFLIWSLIWMYQALKTSTNLKGFYMVAVYCVGVFGGDLICRYIISYFYKL